VEWLGEVPEHWEEKPLQTITSINDEVLPESLSPDYEIEYVDIGSVSLANGIEKTEAMPFGDAPSRARRIPRDGDVLVSTVRTYLKAIAPVVNPPSNLVASTGFAVVRPRPGLEPGFLKYALQEEHFIQQVISRSTGVSYPAINASDVAKISLNLPGSSEQLAIATFLTHETTKIDALIAEQQRLIELLQEKRQAVISHAVTKGLNPAVPMKVSGVEWLGEVPEHWEIIEARREIVFLTSGSRGWAEFYSETGPLFIRIGNLTRNSLDIDLSDAQRVDPPLGSEGARTEVKQGDVLFSITAYLGSVAVVPSSLEAAYVSQHVCLARLAQKRMLPKWLGYAVMSSSGKAYLEAESYGGTKVQLSLDDIKSFPVAVPPINEQQDLMTYIEEALFRVGRLAIDSEKNIALLQERRSALISAAVTGQIDVLGLVPEAVAA
jgi:type I restriction enzyme S subunit